MRVLVVAATEEEVRSLKSEVGSQTQDSRLKTQDLELLITGVGMTATAFALGRHLATNQYDLAINLGIAGSFDRSFALGDVVEITEDTFAELGAEDGDEFLSIEKLGFGTNTYQSTAELSNYYKASSNLNLKQAAAITVNTVSGNEVSIEKITKRLNPQLESMEGAAFFYACREMNLPCLQIRAVSNYVEKRNRDNWKIGLAIKNLNTFAADFFKEL
ncbi:MAG: futalosine hydrolase [Mucilaginibacter sp.]